MLPEFEGGLSVHDVTMSANRDREIKPFGLVECLDPIVRVAVAHEGRPAVQSVAGSDHSFLRQEYEHVAFRMRAAKPEDFNRA